MMSTRLRTMTSAPGWYPVPDQVNTMQYYDGAKGGETIPAPGLDLLEQMAADVRVIKSVAMLWATLTVIGIIVMVVVVASN